MHTLGLRNLAHLTVVALDGIGRIDYLTDSRGVLTSPICPSTT